MDRITIIGLGQIGSSMGLAIKRNLVAQKGPKVEIVGVDREPETAARSRKVGAIDRIEYGIPVSVDGASLVIIATPVSAMPEVMELIGPALKQGAIVIDVGSTKGNVLKWADELLPDHVNFVGGHPMAGSEIPGVAGSRADLFDGRIFCVTPSTRAHADAVKTVIDIIYHLGAEPFFVDAEEHDGLVGGISHLPIALSVSLMNLMRKEPAWRAMGRLAAGSFESMTRVSSGSPEMHKSIFTTNNQQMVRWIDAYIEELKNLRRSIAEGDDEELLKNLKQAARAHDRWLKKEYDTEDEPDLQDIRAQMGNTVEQLLLPDRAIRAIRDLGKRNKKE